MGQFTPPRYCDGSKSRNQRSRASGGHLGQRRGLPEAVVSQEAATINRRSHFEPIIEACHDACQVAAPTDTRDADSATVNLWQRGQQRHAPNHGADSVIGPYVPCLIIGEVAEFGGVGLVWPAVWQRAVGTTACGVQ